jgi:hypothetical protein
VTNGTSYQVRQRLGRGGMGVVDLAVTPEGRAVALKRLVLHGSALDMHRGRLRIRREAEALRRLDHPNIVPLLEVLDDGDEVVLVMPYLSGGTLADQISAYGPLHADHVRALAPPLLGALATAHRLGIVHRDIKPANVLFDHEGVPYLADFGVASLRDATTGLTATGMTIGTPEFMAPEQARGETATPASDVFSLGATLAFAATGAPPYGRGDPRVLIQRAARGRVNPLPPTVPAELRQVLVPMLEPRPERRPTAARAAGGPAGTRLSPFAGRVTGRSAVWVAGIVAAVVLGALAAVAGLAALHRSDAGDALAGAAHTATTAAPTTTAVPCAPLPYRPCGGTDAPFTDGTHCLAGHADYDGDPANGCEAASHSVNGVAMHRSISGNLVPADAVAVIPFHVDDRFSLFCDGSLRVTLTAPPGASMRLDVEHGTSVLGTTTSSDSIPGTVSIDKPSCLSDNSTDLVARVSWTGDRRTAADFTVTTNGTF